MPETIEHDETAWHLADRKIAEYSKLLKAAPDADDADMLRDKIDYWLEYRHAHTHEDRAVS